MIARKRVLSRIKSVFVSRGRKARKIKFGVFRDIVMDLDLSCQAQLFLGLFEREVYPYLRRLSQGIRTAVDIGAGEGEYTLYFLLKTPVWNVLSFEPSDLSRRRIMANLRLNNLEDDGRLKLSSEFVGMSNTEMMCTLDSFISELVTPCLIKMDVDGGEVEILRGAPNTLVMSGVRWLIETHSPELETQCKRILEKAGYVVRIVPNAWWRVFVPELRGQIQNRWLVACREDDLV